MFKLIFKLMVTTVFLVFLTIGLAVWKGGEPFRILGDGTVAVGKRIHDFGDFVDSVIKGGEKIKKNYDEIKDVITPGQEKTEKRNDK